LMEACALLREVSQRERAAEILSGPAFLNLPVRSLLPSLTGQIQQTKQSAPVDKPHFHVFGRFSAGFPWRSHAEWMTRRCGETIGKQFSDADVSALVQNCYRPDLYREAARILGMDAPDKDVKQEGLHSESWQFQQGVELGADQRL